MEQIDGLIKNLGKEDGYKFGTPWRYSEKALGIVVPILKTNEINERDYKTLEEVLDKIKFIDTGNIGRVRVEGKVDEPIFVRTGSALDSKGTQPRVVETSVIITPQTGEIDAKKGGIRSAVISDIPVKCIHASRAICTMGSFTYAGYVAPVVEKRLLSVAKSQSETWGAVREYAEEMLTPTQISDLHIRPEDLVQVQREVSKFSGNINDILKEVPLLENQVGMVIFDMKDVTGIELFDHPDSWKAIHKEVEKRYGNVIGNLQETLFEPKFKRLKPLTKMFLKNLANCEKKQVAVFDGAATISMIGNEIIGEATILNDIVIHLIGLKTGKQDQQKYQEITSRQRSATEGVPGLWVR